MQIGRKYRLYPDPDQASVLAQWIGCARAIYNGKDTEERYLSWLQRYAKFSARTFAPDEGESSFVFDHAYSHLKPAKDIAPWFHEVPSQVYRNALYQRGKAWAKYWADPAHVGCPGRRRKGENDSILLTNELFQFWGAGLVLIGVPKFTVGVVEYHEHRSCGEPNSITISKDSCGRWWISFTFDDGIERKPERQILSELASKTDVQIESLTVGLDRGITQQVTSSDGSVFGFDSKKKARFAKYQRRLRALQKKLARQKHKGSKRREHTRVKLAKVSARIAFLRTDQAHQVSHRIVHHSEASILVFEALNLRGMTRRAKSIPDKTGSGFRRNGASAKSGLNKALLHQSLGKILEFTRYKAVRAGKLVLEVPSAYTSQCCAICSHTEPANRKGIRFSCKKCGHTTHADANASFNIKSRGVTAVLTMLGRSIAQPCVEATKESGYGHLPRRQRSAVEASTSPRKRYGDGIVHHDRSGESVYIC